MPHLTMTHINISMTHVTSPTSMSQVTRVNDCVYTCGKMAPREYILKIEEAESCHTNE